MGKIKKALFLLFHHPIIFIERLAGHIPWILSDKLYVKLQYRAALGRYPDLDNPKTFTEKLQWLKLYDHNPFYTQVVDKITAKEYIAKNLGEEYIIPTLFQWDDPDQINFDALPDKFVLKCNHTGGGAVFICKDKVHFDFDVVKKKLKKQLRTNTFLKTREWPYKNIKRKVFCEQYMEDNSGELRDYKFYCFGGTPFVLLVASNRFTKHNFNYFDLDFNPVDIHSAVGATSSEKMIKPANFETMKDIVVKLCQGFPHVRVDLYNINGHIYFGELTLYDASGFDDMGSDKWNRIFGDKIHLPNKC